MDEIFSDITIEEIPAFRMARYVMITPNPEDDVIAYMDAWAKRSGLLDVAGYVPRKIGWDFPFVPPELTRDFGLRGYVSAYLLPDDFTPACCGAEIAQQRADTYAVITVNDPFFAPFERIPEGYHRLIAYAAAQDAQPVPDPSRLAFEEVITDGDTTKMIIRVPIGAL